VHITHAGWIGLLSVSCSLAAYGRSVRLQTCDAELGLEAGPSAPRLVYLSIPGKPVTLPLPDSSELIFV